MTKFKLEVTPEVSQLSRTLQKEVNLYRRGLKLEMWRALSLLEAAIVIEIHKQFKQRTGLLLNSIPGSKTVEDVGVQVIGSIGPVGVIYAAIQEFGGKTRPHIIKPKYKKALRWVSSQGAFVAIKGRRLRTNTIYAFAKEVHHPGSNIPARPYMRPAFLKTRDKILERFGLYLSVTFTWE